MSYEPTLTPYLDAKPMPRVLVVFNFLAPGTARVKVWRQAGGRQLLVRGGADLAVAGSFGLMDLEAPFGVRCLYYAEQFDADGSSLGQTGTAQTLLAVDETWIHNPFDPNGGITCRTGVETGSKIVGQIDLEMYYPQGRRSGVAVTGQRRGIANVPLTFYGDTIEQSDALDAMFGTIDGDLGLPPFLCIRLAGRFKTRVPAPLFVAVPAPTQTPVNLVAGGTVIGWDVSGPEVDPPSAALANALLSRGDLDAFYTTRAGRDGAYSSRLAMDTDYSIAGYSGDNDDGTTTPPPTDPGEVVAIDNGDGTGELVGVTDDGDGTGTTP